MGIVVAMIRDEQQQEQQRRRRTRASANSAARRKPAVRRAILQDVADANDTRRRATYDDLIAVPDHLVAEIIDGVLYTSPRPASPHAFATATLLMELGPPFQQARGG